MLLASCAVDEGGSREVERDVGLYWGPGVWVESAIATRTALRALQIDFDTLGISSLMRGGAGRFRTLIVPGGDPREMVESLGPVGLDRIRSFVSSEGGFIGLGGGAALAGPTVSSEAGLGLLTTPARWPVDLIAPYPQHSMTDIDRRTGALLIPGAPGYQTLYRWGPEFPNPDPSRTEVIYLYRQTGTPSLVTTAYGSGYVVLAGFQPEFEEGTGADSSGFGADLVDPDSERALLRAMIDYSLGR